MKIQFKKHNNYALQFRLQVIKQNSSTLTIICQYYYFICSAYIINNICRNDCVVCVVSFFLFIVRLFNSIFSHFYIAILVPTISSPFIPFFPHPSAHQLLRKCKASHGSQQSLTFHLEVRPRPYSFISRLSIVSFQKEYAPRCPFKY